MKRLVNVLIPLLWFCWCPAECLLCCDRKSVIQHSTFSLSLGFSSRLWRYHRVSSCRCSTADWWRSCLQLARALHADGAETVLSALLSFNHLLSNHQSRRHLLKHAERNKYRALYLSMGLLKNVEHYQSDEKLMSQLFLWGQSKVQVWFDYINFLLVVNKCQNVNTPRDHVTALDCVN